MSTTAKLQKRRTGKGVSPAPDLFAAGEATIRSRIEPMVRFQVVYPIDLGRTPETTGPDPFRLASSTHLRRRLLRRLPGLLQGLAPLGGPCGVAGGLVQLHQPFQGLDQSLLVHRRNLRLLLPHTLVAVQEQRLGLG